MRFHLLLVAVVLTVAAVALLEGQTARNWAHLRELDRRQAEAMKAARAEGAERAAAAATRPASTHPAAPEPSTRP